MSPTVLAVQEQLPTIDGLAGAVEGLRGRLMGNARLTSRELRDLWASRLRPFWRLRVELYRALSRRFLEHGDNYLASEVTDEGAQFFGDDVALILTRALALARSGAPQAAQELLSNKSEVLAEAEEATSLRARTFKDLWKSSGQQRYLRESFELYHHDYTTTKGDRTFPGVNAASMALFLGRQEHARHLAGEVLALLRAKSDTANYWDQVTIAECLLVSGQIEEARAAYAGATRDGAVAHAHLATTRAQARLLLREQGHEPGSFDACFPLPNVVAFTGHRTDAPDRPAPRFPEAEAPAVKERIRAWIVQHQAGFGYAAAASGADILFLEAMQEAGLETYVHLPLPEEEFIRQSVDPAWMPRYRAVTERATELTFAASASANANAFDYGNRLLYGAASQHAQQLGTELRLLAVWDGRAGDGAGGTADYVQMVRGLGRPVEVIAVAETTEGTVAARPLPTETPDRLFTALTFTFSPDDEAGPRLAALLDDREVVHREVADRQVRLLLASPAAAARVALRIAPHVKSALGLHTGPIELTTHALVGTPVLTGEHVAISELLAAQEPAGLIYTSRAFAALLGLQAPRDMKAEFLGYRALRAGAAREPIFRLSRDVAAL